MSNEVYANGMEISCKQAAGKTICAFPDPCFTPPQTPATPPGVPIPYPNTGMASDCSDGSSTVSISGQEVMLKDKSSFKKSTGDEAGSAPQKGLMTSSNKGKVIFTAWSMDVKAEGENVVRHLDMTTGNHACPNANAAVPWPYADAAAMKKGGACAGDIKKEKTACQDYKPYKKNGHDVCEKAGLSGAFTRDKATATKRTKSASEDPCMAARRCRLVAFNAKPDGINGCCPAQTGDHIVPKSSFFVTSVAAGEKFDGWDGYNIDKAPTMCLEGGSCTGSHGLRHAHHKAYSPVEAGTPMAFEDEMKHCADGASAVAPGCSVDCIEAQLTKGHSGPGMDQDQPIKHSPTGKNYQENPEALEEAINKMIPTAPAPR